MSKTVLVTGATGKQGGAVVRALQDSDLQVLALTRNVSSPAAQRLAALKNVKLVQGDLSRPSDIFQTAKEVAKGPIWGTYLVQANEGDKDGSIEESQGKSFIDAAIAASLEYFVYASVQRGSPPKPTPVPTWAAKHRIEQHLSQQAAGGKMQFVVLQPTAFMEGLTNNFFGKALSSAWKDTLQDKPLQMIAVKDIGYFGALALRHPEEYAGRYLGLAGATMTWKQANEIFKAKVGKDMPTTFGIVSHLLLHIVKEFALMFKFLRDEGTSADVDECKTLHPGMLDFGTWLAKESEFRTTQ